MGIAGMTPGVAQALNIAIIIRSIDQFSKTFNVGIAKTGQLRSAYGGLIGTITSMFNPATIAVTVIMAIFLAFYKCTQAAIEFEWRLVELNKVYQGTTAEIQSQLVPAIKEIGETYGLLADDVTNAMVRWAQQGKKGIELQRLTEQAIRLTMVTMIDQTQATEYLTAAINQFGLTVESTEDIIATWNWLANTQTVTAAYLAQSLSYCGAVAHEYGVTLEEASTYLTLFSRAGISASKAGYALRTIFTRLYDTKAQEVLKDIGIATYDASGNFREADIILSELAGKWDTLTDAQRHNIGKTIAGLHYTTQFNLLMKQYSDTQDMLATKEEMRAKAQEEVNRTLDTAHKQWEILQSKIHNVVLEVGENFLPLAKMLITGIINIIDYLRPTIRVFEGVRVVTEAWQQVLSQDLMPIMTEINEILGVIFTDIMNEILEILGLQNATYDDYLYWLKETYIVMFKNTIVPVLKGFLVILRAISKEWNREGSILKMVVLPPIRALAYTLKAIIDSIKWLKDNWAWWERYSGEFGNVFPTSPRFNPMEGTNTTTTTTVYGGITTNFYGTEGTEESGWNTLTIYNESQRGG